MKRARSLGKYVLRSKTPIADRQIETKRNQLNSTPPIDQHPVGRSESLLSPLNLHGALEVLSSPPHQSIIPELPILQRSARPRPTTKELPNLIFLDSSEHDHPPLRVPPDRHRILQMNRRSDSSSLNDHRRCRHLFHLGSKVLSRVDGGHACGRGKVGAAWSVTVDSEEEVVRVRAGSGGGGWDMVERVSALARCGMPAGSDEVTFRKVRWWGSVPEDIVAAVGSSREMEVDS